MHTGKKSVSGRSGYTFFELMVVIGVTIIFGSVALLNLPTGLRTKAEVDNAIGKLKSHLVLVQQRAISQENGAKWGVHLDTSVAGNHFYHIFYGDSYETGVIVETIYLPNGIIFLSPSDGNSENIIFDKVTGKVDSGHSIVLGLKSVGIGSYNNTNSGNLVVFEESGAIEQLDAVPSFDVVISLSPDSGTVQPGGSAATNIRISVLSGIPQSASLFADSLPSGATADFSPINCSPTCISRLTLQAGQNTPVGNYPILISAASGELIRYANYSLRVVSQPVSSPGAPTGLTAVSGGSQINLSWTAPIDEGGSPVSNYNIYRGDASGSEVLVETIGNLPGFADTGLINGNRYYYQVSAVNSGGEGPLSSEASGEFRDYLRVFSTRNKTSPILAGADGSLNAADEADRFCSDSASAAGLSGAWKAWFSNPADRFYHYAGPYKLMNGSVIADNWGDLIDGNIADYIRYDEYGSYIGSPAPVLTNVTVDGRDKYTDYANTCGNWTLNQMWKCTSYDPDGSCLAGTYIKLGTGSMFYKHYGWTNLSDSYCAYPSGLALYCFEQISN